MTRAARLARRVKTKGERFGGGSAIWFPGWRGEAHRRYGRKASG